MPDFVYHLIVIVVTALAVIRGYRKGLTEQVASVVALCFGLICGHLFEPPVEDLIRELYPELSCRLGGDCFLEMVSAGSVYVVTYLIIRLLLGVLNKVDAVFGRTIINSLAGALFCMFNYLFFLSIILNLTVDYYPGSALLKYGNDRDGNVVEIVVKIAPGLLGVPGVEELGHEVQLEEAKKIS